MARILAAITLFVGALTFGAAALYLFINQGAFWSGLAVLLVALMLAGGLGHLADKDRAAALVSQQLKDNPGLPVDMISALAGQLLQDTTRSGDAKRRSRE